MASFNTPHSSHFNIDPPERIALAALPTPLIKLNRFSKRLQSECPNAPAIWVKRDDMTGGPEGGNKLRKLEFLMAYAINNGYDTVITCGGLQSNHCRATALVGARLGIDVHLVLRGDKPDLFDANLLVDHLAGAVVDCIPLKEYIADLDGLLKDRQNTYARQGKKALIIPTGASDDIGIWGYIEAARELSEDFKRMNFYPDYIISAAGSGGTLAGLVAGRVLYNMSANIAAVNVCDDATYFQRRVAEDIKGWIERYDLAKSLELGLQVDDITQYHFDVNIIEGYVGPGYAKVTGEVLSTIHELTKLEGIVLDPVYTGKAFHGLVSEIKAGRFDHANNMVFVHTGGQMGLTPYKEALTQILAGRTSGSTSGSTFGRTSGSTSV